MVKYASMTHEEFFNEQMKDPEFAKAYEESEEEFKALQKAIELRMQQKLSQTEVAQRMNTTRSVVCRLEAGLSNGTPPSLGMLKRYAIALGKKWKFVWFDRSFKNSNRLNRTAQNSLKSDRVVRFRFD